MRCVGNERSLGYLHSMTLCENGNTALIHATSAGHRTFCELLLDRKAELEAKNKVCSSLLLPVRVQNARLLFPGFHSSPV